MENAAIDSDISYPSFNGKPNSIASAPILLQFDRKLHFKGKKKLKSVGGRIS